MVLPKKELHGRFWVTLKSEVLKRQHSATPNGAYTGFSLRSCLQGLYRVYSNYFNSGESNGKMRNKHSMETVFIYGDL